MGEYTANEYFYKPSQGASGAAEMGKFDDAMDVADAQIEANKDKWVDNAANIATNVTNITTNVTNIATNVTAIALNTAKKSLLDAIMYEGSVVGYEEEPVY